MWIVPDADRFPTVYTFPRDPETAIRGVVVHWTASPFESIDRETGRLLRWSRGQGARSSTHLCIMRDGRLIQFAALDDVAEHTNDRTARWDGAHPVDRFTIGLDLCNVGPLTHDGDVYRNPYGGEHMGSVVHDADANPYEGYTARQVATLIRVVPALVRLCPALADVGAWRGHSAIQPGKPDPGPVFPWGTLRAAVQSAGRGV